ncbi:DUF2971 domain-containing protein [Wohlfahrtiimonas populi]|uniref:DUF2971 domain-containing protein n=1 Tax=Wohlfahrtiimonas populi TaxID=1940240 RepID=UPI00098D3932|nr:DUF2971 domain-containing protein [Wohlfahrtiimonas populi]
MLYKYFSDDAIQYFDDSEYFTLKFTKLEDYNDPYEQSLAVDLAKANFNNVDYLIGLYQKEIYKCKGYLATFFSNRPDITPMWAHYGNEQRGFVIAINEKMLVEYLKDRGLEKISDFKIDNVDYRDGIDSEFQKDFEHHNERGKGYWYRAVNEYLLKAFYFFKQDCWKYEEERRLIIKDNHKILFCKDNNMLLRLPKSCIDYIIFGSKTNDIVKEKLQVVFNQPMYEFRISRSNVESYFIDSEIYTYCDISKDLVIRVPNCSECGEPIEDSYMNKGMCFWCYARNMD